MLTTFPKESNSALSVGRSALLTTSIGHILEEMLPIRRKANPTLIPVHIKLMFKATWLRPIKPWVGVEWWWGDKLGECSDKQVFGLLITQILFPWTWLQSRIHSWV